MAFFVGLLKNSQKCQLGYLKFRLILVNAIYLSESCKSPDDSENLGKNVAQFRRKNFIDFLMNFNFIDFNFGLCLYVTSNLKLVGKISSVKYFHSQLFQLTLVSNQKVINDQDTYNYYVLPMFREGVLYIIRLVPWGFVNLMMRSNIT